MAALRLKNTWKMVDELKPTLLMMVVVVAYSAANVLYKLALEDGMSLEVVNAYRFIFATAFMVPLALFYGRKDRHKLLAWRVLLMTFLCGLFGSKLLLSDGGNCGGDMAAVRLKNTWKMVDGLKPTLLMMVVAVAYSAANVLYKLALEDGMSLEVVNAYRFIFATAFMVPLALFYGRKDRHKLLAWRVLLMTFLCGLFGGTLFQNLYVESLGLTSATFVAAIFNLGPAITFILAISFGLEKLNLGMAAGKAKVIGTIIGIGGAMLMTFYKGAEIKIGSSHINLLNAHKQQNSHVASPGGSMARRLLGVLCAFGACFSYALWLIIQGKMSSNAKEYPSHHTNTALMSLMTAIQSTVFALCVERDWKQWKLGWNLRLFIVAYSGIVPSGLIVIAIAWIVEKRGPLFVAIFNPLVFLLVAIAAFLFLEEKLYLGSVLGAVLIVCSLYMVLWGKGKEAKQRTQLLPSQESQDDKTQHSSINSAAYFITKDNDDSSKVGREEQHIQGREEEDKVPANAV